MPYDINAEKLSIPVVAAKVPKLPREKFRQSVIISKTKKSVLGSMYSIVNQAVSVKKYV